ncbi:hypothetical protein [Flagellimonas sp. S3867]|uniref:hypothetical protein n=1 Tax=Flagellimonas sp. S3867 TaxID=2768063 RepID=UPI00168642AA|nr:hypothetical protein [Flagellimonas sp. S3867]
MRFFLFIFSLFSLIACNQFEQSSNAKIKKSIPAKANDSVKKVEVINYAELSKLTIGENYITNSSLVDFNTKFKVIDSVIHSKDEFGDGDTIATFFIGKSRFNYSNSIVYFTHLDLSDMKVQYQGLPLNFLHIDSIHNNLSISQEKMEVSKDSVGNSIKRIFLNTKSNELTDDQMILVFVNDILKQIQYFNGND